MSKAQSQVIRGFNQARVNCPKHDRVYVWTAETDHHPVDTLEVVKYDCGCLVTWQSHLLGATPVFEVEVDDG